jgi:hypothetical protein
MEDLSKPRLIFNGYFVGWWEDKEKVEQYRKKVTIIFFKLDALCMYQLYAYRKKLNVYVGWYVVLD